MKQKQNQIFPLAKLAEKALKEAVRETVKDHERTGHPLAVWRNGAVKLVSPSSFYGKK